MRPKLLTALLSIGLSVLGAIVIDYHEWLNYRKKHPRAKFDFAVAFGRVLKSLYIGLPGALGVSVATPEGN